MRSIDRTSVLRPRLALAAAVAALSILAVQVKSAGPDRVTIYAPQQTFQLALNKQQEREYVDLIVALAQFGTVASDKKGDKFKLRFSSIAAQFEDGSRSAKIDRNSVLLPDPFRLSENSAEVSLRSLVELLPHFLNEKVDYHEISRRIFIGDGGTRLALALQRSPAVLVLTFTGTVSPRISVEGGKMRLVFDRDGVIPPAESWRFNDSFITAASFEERSSGPELTINATEPILATFGAGGRTISIAAAPQAAAQAAQSAPATQPPTQPAAPIATPPQTPEAAPPTQALEQPAPATEPNPLATRPHVAVLIDASHGGNEPGAALSSDLAEKDVTLALARRLRNELQNRGVSCSLIRDSDATLTLEQRAVVANTARPGLYLAIHAGALGRGVRIYSAMLPAAKLAPAAFQPWETAQAGYVGSSRAFATAMIDALSKGSVPFPVALMPAPVRPLNNIAGPALAIELAPRNGDVGSLANAGYQQSIASALAAAISTAGARARNQQALAGAQP